MTGVRYQKLYFSAFVLSAAIALDDCRHSQNMRLRRARSSRIRLQKRYGYAKDQAHKDVDTWFSTLK